MERSKHKPLSQIHNQRYQASQPIAYCLYARKSTESDEQQALSIDSQLNEMLEIAKRENLNIAETKREAHSAKNSGERPEFADLLQGIREGRFNGILTWAPDRLSRNAGDLGSLVDLIDRGKLVSIKTYGQAFSNSPNDKFLLMILCSQAKLENDNRGVNVIRGLKTKCNLGWRPCLAPLGYLNQKYAAKGEKKIFIDPVRGPIIQELFRKVAEERMTGRALLRWLNTETEFRSRGGRRLTLSTLYQILATTFYYGEYEYPVGSGKFYQGEHDPLITKEQFDTVRTLLSVGQRAPLGSKEFDFIKLLKCGACGYGVTATEKFKKLKKEGTVRRYVYYHCTNKGHQPCRQPFIREEELIDQLIHLFDNIQIDETRVQEKLYEEIKRFAYFQQSVMKHELDKRDDINTIDLKNYAKYILKHGKKEEKRYLLSLFQTPLILKDERVLVDYSQATPSLSLSKS